MRILVVGDSYFPSAAYRSAFDALADHHEIRYAEVVDDLNWVPMTASEQRLREVNGNPAQVIAVLDHDEVLVHQGAPVTDAVLDASPELRLVCCARGGPVNVDLDAATARGIPVVTTPGKNAEAVADLTIAFLIMLTRRLPEVARFIEGGGEFGHDNYEGRAWFGHDLGGLTLGMIGVGQVGRRVAARARGFAMRVLAHDPFVAPAALSALGVEPTDLPTLLGTSDFVSLHARADAGDPPLIGREEIAHMKRGTFLVNTARAGLVDEAALGEALASGQVAGAAFDLVSPSPAGGRHPLLAFPNMIITPHIGGSTAETLQHAAEMAAAEIERLAAGEPLVNVANRAELDARGRGPAL